ncbi:polysaccharide lyase family 1 protein [Hyaloscypha bicolor E]|uniref:Polysaccharide lyase family 1 protein n=1 Tax=Hyaloscypha bicolor E TaxID=1095630 RepID=A0A2J6TMB4_9HELO|nr:polysaccharide lyase family 1 protein [Hyaloscypha bicolor E]PMD64156.1 polysaccharide lyase family 1 protein [Hyaloscypha bicolor E]
MKLSILSPTVALLSQLVSCIPTPTENVVGHGGTVTTVSTLAQFTAVANNAKNNDIIPRIIVVSGTITSATQVRIGSNKTIIGLPGAKFVGIGLFVWKQNDVILRNIISQDVLAPNGDGITIQASRNVWVDYCEFYSDLTHDKDYYNGLVDISHASEWVTISNTYLYDHWKASLIGHSNNDAVIDTGHLHVTQCNNYWLNIGSRTPSLRYGLGHIFNSYFENMNTGINSRDGAQILVQGNVFSNVTEPIAALYSHSTGHANVFDTYLGGVANTAPVGTLSATSMPYSYSLLGFANVIKSVVQTAGATLSF